MNLCNNCGNENIECPSADPINPAHYKDQCSLECIQVMEMMFGDQGLVWFCLGNAFKYMWRFENKNGLEDLKKARWYLDKIKDLTCSEIQKLYKERLMDLLDELEGGE